MTRLFKRNVLFFVLIVLSISYLLLHLVVALRPPRSLMMWFHIDDAYYYYQVARNVAEGGGFTFDGIGKSNGFHPLWMLINIPVFYFARFNPYLPFRILVMVSALITLLGGWLLYDLLRAILHKEVALLGFGLWLFFWPTHNILTQTSMEAGINAFSILLLLWTTKKLAPRKSTKTFLWLGLAAVIVLFSRLDNIILVALFGLWLVFHQRPMRNLLLLDVLTVFITVFTSILLRVGVDERLGFLTATQVFFVVAVLSKTITRFGFGLYQHPKTISLQSLAWRLVKASVVSTFITVLFMLGLLYINVLSNFPRSALLIEAGLSLVLTALIRIVVRQLSPAPPHMDLSLKKNFSSWLRRGTLYMLPILVFLGAYLLWNIRTFGTPLPISGQIKQWWGTILTVYGRKHQSLWTIFGVLPNTREDPQPWFLIEEFLYQPFYDFFQIDKITQAVPFLIVKLSLTALYGSLLAWLYSKQSWKIREILSDLSFGPLITAALFLPLYYGFTGYLAMRIWYWVPQIIVTMFIFLILVNGVFLWIRRQRKPIKYLRILPLALVILLIINFNIKLMGRFPVMPNENNDHDTLKITNYLEENTPKGSLIGMTGGGTEAYFIQDRTIINLDGLINSKTYFDYLRAGEGEIYLDQIGLDYVLGRSVVFFDSDPYAWTFTDRLERIDSFEGYDLFKFLDL